MREVIRAESLEFKHLSCPTVNAHIATTRTEAMPLLARTCNLENKSKGNLVKRKRETDKCVSIQGYASYWEKKEKRKIV